MSDTPVFQYYADKISPDEYNELTTALRATSLSDMRAQQTAMVEHFLWAIKPGGKKHGGASASFEMAPGTGRTTGLTLLALHLAQAVPSLKVGIVVYEPDDLFNFSLSKIHELHRNWPMTTSMNNRGDTAAVLLEDRKMFEVTTNTGAIRERYDVVFVKDPGAHPNLDRIEENYNARPFFIFRVGTLVSSAWASRQGF